MINFLSNKSRSFKKNSFFFTSLILFFCFFVFSGCNKNLDPNRPQQAEGKRKKNIEEGRGASIGSILGKRGGTNYEFSTSNPLWRASLETLDFLPLATVDYSGGIIITDWYSENSSNKESIKISLRFLGNEIRSESIKVIIHKQTCTTNQNCRISLLSNSKIKDELHSTILRKAALIEKQTKEKK